MRSTINNSLKRSIHRLISLFCRVESSNVVAQEIFQLREQLSNYQVESVHIAEEARERTKREIESNRRQTIIATLIASIAAAAGAYQGFVAHNTLVDARNDQRAWIRVTVLPGDLNWFGSSEGAFPISELPRMAPSLLVSNVGHSPAFSVRGGILGLASTENYDLINDKLSGNNKAVCDQTVQQKKPDNETIMFPGEKPQINSYGVLTKTVSFFSEHSDHVRETKDFDRGSQVKIILYGCIVYKLSQSDSFHHTMFTYEIEPRDVIGNHGFMFRVGVKLTADQLTLRERSNGDDAN